MRLTEDTSLATLRVPHLETVLDELFRVPPAWLFPNEPRPATVGELAARVRLPVATVIERLTEVERMSADIEIGCEELASALAGPEAERPVLLDVREEWEYEICHIAGSLLLVRLNLAELLPRLAAAPAVAVVCHHGVRSYSAAMALRAHHGIARARSLAGGVEAWAMRVDPAMARY
jgi:rhodanese-related sulfurtransferase